MSNDIRSILVHLDGPERAGERLVLGRRLAAEHGAALAVLYGTVPAALVAPLAGEAMALMLESLVALDEDRRAKTRRAFDALVREPGVRATWSEASDLSAQGEVARCAMYADLLVLGQHDPTLGRAGGVPPHFVEAVLAQSGRPAIVVPYTGPATPTFRSVAIAWKETAEAARAVAAALPLLARASDVHVLTWGSAQPALRGPWTDLPGYLARHGIRAEWHQQGPETDDTGELILSRCADISADLLVMGCYGHMRAREWLLGGASRTVLQSMTLPVLMAH